MPKFIYKILIAILIVSVFPISKQASANAFTRAPSNLGLVGYWPMDEGVGAKAGDASGNGKIGTLVGTTWANGKYGRALSFNGSNSRLTTNFNSGLNDFTVSLWFKDDGVIQNYERLVDKNYIGGFWLGRNNNAPNTWGGGILESGSPYGIFGTFTDGKWNHLVSVRNGTTHLLYANGIQVATNTVSSAALDATNLEIGNGTTNQAGGVTMDDVRIFSRALSSTDISKLYSSGQVTQRRASDSGLVGYWPMNEGRGSVIADSSGQGNKGTLSGAAWAEGKRGKALSFNSSFATVPHSESLNISNALSLSAWVKLNEVTNRGIIEKTVSGNVNTQYLLFTESNRFKFRLVKGGYSTIQSNSNISADRWYYVTATWDGTTMRLYVDGVLQSDTFPVSAPISTGTGVTLIGTLGNSVYGMNGTIDEVRVYNRALSQNEVTTLYKTGIQFVSAGQNSRLTDGLLGLWSFNGPDINWATNTAYDRSGQGNNGTISGLTTKSVISGRVGQALKLISGSQNITFPNISLANTPYTVSAWVYKNDSSDFNIVGGGIGGTNNAAHYIIRSSKAYFGNYSCDLGGVQTISPNKWYHIVFVMGSDQKKSIYVNGSLDVGPVASCGYYQSYVNLIANSCCGGAGSGILDEVRIYNRALNANEIKQLFNMGK